MTVTVGDVLSALDALAPPHLCLGSDPRGLLVGDPAASVSAVVVALDVTASVVEAARAGRAEMIVAHHPLVYHPLSTVRADQAHPESVVLACARSGIAVACAHTNWDVALGGINDVLAGLLGLENTRPLQITFREPLVKIVVFVPEDHREAVIDALASAGAGALGDYERCAFWTPGTGTFRPLPGARPFVGAVGASHVAPEERLEMIAPAARQAAMVRAMKTAHPYEEVAFDVVPLANAAVEQGIGRVGELSAPLEAAAFVARVKAALVFPEVRAPALPPCTVRTIAVCGGAGAFLVPDAVAAGADALVTSDVRHHEFVDAQARGLLLIDAGHAQTETPGTRELARRLGADLTGAGVDVSFVE